MGTGTLNVIRLRDSLYSDKVNAVDSDAVYCEVRYRRDRSSFAGIVFRLNEKKVVTVRECVEEVVHEIGSYEKVYIGCDSDYIHSIQEILSEKKVDYGIEILFLVYSNVRSSQIVFEDLISKIDESMDRIKQLL